MSNNNKQQIKASSFIKYGFIAALLLVAPITLINQMVLPMV